MSIATEIERLKKAKNDLFRAVTAKGGVLDLSQKLDEYASGVDTIPLAVEGSGKYRVRFFDYDGTILKTVCTDGGAVTAPSVPEHERLLFQEWNNDFDDIASDLDVGAIYTTKSGMSEFDFDLNAQTGKSVTVRMNVLVSGVVIAWGDGVIETITATGAADFTHEYSSYGKYTVKVSGSWQAAGYFCPDNGQNRYTLTSAHLAGVSGMDNMFFNCYALRSITADTAVNQISSNAFQGTVIPHLNVPRNMPSVINFLLQAGKLKTVSLPRNFDLSKGAAFGNCSCLQEILLPQTAVLGADTFKHTALAQVEIPGTVTNIQGFCFGSVSSLFKVVMKPAVPPVLATNSFPADGSLKEIIVPAGCGEAYKSATNWSTFADIINEEE